MWIINGKIFTMAGECFENGYVKINGRVIEGVGTMEEAVKKELLPVVCIKKAGSNNAGGNHKKDLQEAGPDTILDVQGAWVMPGMIEAHAHIGMTEEKSGLKGDDGNEQTNPVFPGLRGLDGINPLDPAFHDAIQAGITSVMTGPGSADVVGGQFAFIKTHGRCADKMVVISPAAMKVAFGENPKTSYGERKMCPDTRMGIAYLLRKELFKASQYLEKKAGGKLEELDFDMEQWIPVLKREIPLKAHAHRTDDILTAIRIAKEYNLDLTLDHCTEGHLIIGEIVKSGFPVIAGTDLTSRSKVEVEYMSFKTAGVLAEAGVKVAVTTDHPVTLIQYLPICAGYAVKYGMSMEDGLKALTIHPAQICRADDRVGSLEIGKDADIAIFDGNPMEVFTHTLYTIIEGEIVYDRADAGRGCIWNLAMN